jgi:predicted dehydrogenase
MTQVGVGIIGSRFMANIHTESLKRIPDARVVAVASPTEAHARGFAERHGIGSWFTDHRRLLELPEVDMVVVCTPNRLHAPIAIDAARAGKHVVVDCVRNDREPQQTGEDGTAVLELLSAAYESARLGGKVSLEQPFRPGVARPIDCWLRVESS